MNNDCEKCREYKARIKELEQALLDIADAELFNDSYFTVNAIINRALDNRAIEEINND